MKTGAGAVMKRYTKKISRVLKQAGPAALIISSVAVLTACGGGSGSEVTQAEDTEAFFSNFTLNISDAPVDNASEVVVFFSTVELRGNGDAITIDVTDSNGDPREIDLLTLQGNAFASLIEDFELPAGEYTQIRIPVSEASYVVMDDGTWPLSVPSGEVKLDGFTALAGEEQTFTVEFDLRKSLVDPQGQDEVFLKPRGIRLVDNSEAGGIEGRVGESLLTQAACSVKSDFTYGNAVYVFEGTGLDVASLGDDADTSATDTEFRPVAIATVNTDASSDQSSYGLGYLEAGDYTLALTCLGHLDEPETDDDNEFSFLTVKEVTVAANEVTIANFDN